MSPEQLADMSEKELYVELGRQLTPSAGFGGDDIAFLAGRGKAWFSEHVSDIRSNICGRVERTNDILTDASTIAAALAGIAPKAIALVVAFLIVKQGLTSFCGGHED